MSSTEQRARAAAATHEHAKRIATTGAAAPRDFAARDPAARGSTATNDIIVQVRCLRHVYPDRTAVDLCGLDFTVCRGQRVVVLGANGSGKTTLIFHLLGLLSPIEGEVTVFGVNPAKQFREVRQRVGVVLQDVDDQIIGPTVWDDVTFTPRALGWPRERVARAGEAILERLGIQHLRHKIPHYLSGGEKRKVALAGALVTEPELLILDEPFTGLDPRSRSELVTLLEAVSSQLRLAYIISTHEIDFVPHIADYVYVLAGPGGIALSGTPEHVFSQGDRLRQLGVDAPSLAELFASMKDRGWDVDIPLTVDQAISELDRVLTSSERKPRR
ncbi:MAG: energy-coupling factor ABC transporter ATP-binding protein [Bacillota bacterium]|nr:energy-coupling factor ABC transporter ATP-binding protein [Bacillota bacterium]